MKKNVKLQHQVPFKILPEERVFFLTICGLPRGKNQFALPQSFEAVLEATRYYHDKNVWWTRLLLAMPDHLHLITQIPETRSLSTCVRNWKRHLNRTAGLMWQDNYFDHRLRHEESARNKADYILHNPVRAKLVDSINDWPFIWIADG